MSLFQKNIDLGKPLRLSAFRKVAIGTWRTAGDPSVYGFSDMEVEPALAYIEKLKAKSGQKVTLTHFTGKAMAETIRRHPQINCMLRWGRLYPRKTVDVFFQVATDTAGEDLSGMTIRSADQKSIPEIAREMQEKVEQIRLKGDPAFKKMKKSMGMLPGFLTGFVITLVGYLMYTFNLWTPLLGSPRDPFGSVMITNIGSLGLEMAFAPLVPYSRVPALLALGSVRDAPVVRDDKVVVAQVSRMCMTFDHRIMDGVHAAHISKTMKAIFENPEKELGVS